jgi:hypothetical protein
MPFYFGLFPATIQPCDRAETKPCAPTELAPRRCGDAQRGVATIPCDESQHASRITDSLDRVAPIEWIRFAITVTVAIAPPGHFQLASPALGRLDPSESVCLERLAVLGRPSPTRLLLCRKCPEPLSKGSTWGRSDSGKGGSSFLKLPCSRFASRIFSLV